MPKFDWTRIVMSLKSPTYFLQELSDTTYLLRSPILYKLFGSLIQSKFNLLVLIFNLQFSHPMIPQVRVEHKFNFTLKVPRLSFLFNLQSQSPLVLIIYLSVCIICTKDSKCLPSAKVMTFWHCRWHLLNVDIFWLPKEVARF